MAAAFPLRAGGPSPAPLVAVPGQGRAAPVLPPSRGDGALRAAVPAALPGHGAATLHELFAASPRDAGWAGFLAAAVDPQRPWLWIQERMAILESGRVHPPALGAVDLIHVEARDAAGVLWAMEEGLRCAAIGCVIGEVWGDPARLDFTATRRLAVAAERHGVAAWLVRLGGSANLSGARFRWRLESAPGPAHPFNPRAPGRPAWEAELFRARGSPPGRWRVAGEPPARTAADGDLVAGAADRALGEDRRAG